MSAFDDDNDAQRRSGNYEGVGSPDNEPRSGGPKGKQRRASVVFRRDEDKQLDALRGQGVEIEADSAAFRALEERPDGKNVTKESMFPSSNKKKKGYLSSLFGGGSKGKEDSEDDSDGQYEHPQLIEGRQNVQDAGNYMLTIGMVYGIRTMTGRRDFFHALLVHNSYFYDTDSGDESDWDSEEEYRSDSNDDDSVEADRRRRRKIKNSHKKFSEGLKSLFGFSKAKRSDGGPRIVRKRYKNSNSGVSYAYTYKRGDSPRNPPTINDDESDNSNEEKVEITEEDFTYEIEVSFPPEGSPGPPFPTPEHKLPQAFKFKDYMPNAFRAVRHLSGISEVEYIQSVANPNLNYIEFLANSKSGQFFFYSHDRKYMIKTMTKSESQYLRKIFPQYLRHLSDNPDSLMVRFYGMHRVKMRYLDSRIYFVIMSSVFDAPENIQIHHKYDIKGSSIGRHVSKKHCRENVDVVKKDLNLVEDGKRLMLGREGSKKLQEALKTDSRFLRKLNIMDYSLLIGIHEMDPRGSAKGEGEYSDQDDPYADDNDDDAAVDGAGAGAARAYFRRFKGGFKGEAMDNGRQEIYYLGLIDVLTLYSFAKKAETVLKSLTGVDVRELSAVDPDWYAERFTRFVLHHTDYQLHHGKKMKDRGRLRKEKILRQSGGLEDGYNSEDALGSRRARSSGKGSSRGRDGSSALAGGEKGGGSSSKLKNLGKGIIASNRLGSPSKSPNNGAFNSNNSSGRVSGGSGGGSGGFNNSGDSFRRNGLGNDSSAMMNNRANAGSLVSTRDDSGFGYYAGNSFTPMANASVRSPRQLEQDSKFVQPSQDFVPLRSSPVPNINTNQQPRSNSASRGGGSSKTQGQGQPQAQALQQFSGRGDTPYNDSNNARNSNSNNINNNNINYSNNNSNNNSNAGSDQPPPRSRPGRRQLPMAPSQGPNQGNTQSVKTRRDDML